MVGSGQRRKPSEAAQHLVEYLDRQHARLGLDALGRKGDRRFRADVRSDRAGRLAHDRRRRHDDDGIGAADHAHDIGRGLDAFAQACIGQIARVNVIGVDTACDFFLTRP